MRTILVTVMIFWCVHPAYAVVFYNSTNCSAATGARSFDHSNHPDLASELFDVNAVSMGNAISSMVVPPYQEVILCDGENFAGSCSRLVNHSGSEYGCVNFVATWTTGGLPRNNAAGSLMVQPRDWNAYWDLYDYKERLSDPGTGRIGFVELWSTPRFEESSGFVEYKLYSSDGSFGNNIFSSLTARSIKIYGDIAVRLCLNGTTQCDSGIAGVDYVRVGDREVMDLYGDYLGPNDRVTGARVYQTAPSSILVTSAEDGQQQGRSFAAHMIDQAPSGIKAHYSHGDSSVWHPASCPSDWWDMCSAENWCQSTVYYPCCSATIRRFMGEVANVSLAGFNGDLEFAGDASIVFLDGHGTFTDGDTDVAKIYILNSSWTAGYCFGEENRIWHSWDDISSGIDSDHNWGERNTEWLLTTACNSLGHSSTTWQDVAWAYRRLFDSGVHGIGGFHRLSQWFTGGWSRSGSDIASDFWDELEVSPVAEAWGTIKEYSAYYPNREPSFFTAEDCDCSDPNCNSRMDHDYHYVNPNGPMDDPNPNSPYFCYHTYEA